MSSRSRSAAGHLRSFMTALIVECRHAARGLAAARGAAVLVLTTLALGIGANTAIFSIVHAMLIEPLPYREADRLAIVWLDRGAAGYPRGPLSGPDLRDLRAGAQTFAEFGGIWASGTIALEGDGQPEQLRGALVTTNFFRVLGADSAFGRTFRDEDGLPGAEPTILLGWDLFQRRFGGDPAVVGRRIMVNEEPVTVVGVMPAGFRLLLPPDAAVPDSLQAWAPFWPGLEEGPRRNLFLRVVGRMRPGVTLQQARDDVAAIGRRVATELGNPQRAFVAVGLREDSVREIRPALLMLLAGVGILLLIAWVNVASLLVARAAGRRRETAVRLALGASQQRLVVHWLTEGLLLTALGAAGGVLVGYVLLKALVALAPPSLDRLAAADIDPTVLLFAAGSSLLWGLVFSGAPATELWRVRAGAALQPATRSGTAAARHGVRPALVGAQVALSVVLMVCAVLLVRAFHAVVRIDPGFRSDRQLTFRLAVPGRYDSRDAFNALARTLQARLEQLPGVAGVGAISHLPYDDLPNWALTYGTQDPLPAGAGVADSRAVSAGLLETWGVRLVDGRLFTDADDDPARPVAIVSERLAEELWPGRSAIGQTLVTSVAGMNAPAEGGYARLTVVGVIGPLRLRSLVEESRPQIFVPWRYAQRNPVAWVVRGSPGMSRDALARLTPHVRGAVASVDPRLAIYDVRPLDSYVDEARSARRYTVVLAAAFALAALLLTLVGVYGVLAYAVTVRRQELGVRAALGADPRRLRSHVVREGVQVAAAGCVVGLVAAAAAAGLLQYQLYAIRSTDPASYGAAVVLVLSGAAVAAWIPARRATRISPAEALRE